MRRLTRLLLLPLAGLPAHALAQGAESAADTPIVVTGAGLGDTPAIAAYDVKTLDREVLARSSSGLIEDVLGNVAGFQEFRRSDSRSANPSAQGVTLRALGGNASSRTLVLLDGVPQADPFFGYVPFNALAPDRLASARVTRGGGAGAFGAGAVAGTIELSSASAAQLGLFSGAALVDDRGETSLAGTFAPQLGSGFAVVSGRWDHGTGFWTTPAAQRVPASVKAAYDSWSTGVRVVAPLGDQLELQANVSAFDDHRVLRFAGGTSHSEGEDASLRLVSRGPWQVDALAYVQARGFDAVTVSAVTFKPSLNEYRTPSTGIGGKLELRPPVGGGHVLRFGGDWRIGDGTTSEDVLNTTTGTVTARRISGGRNSMFGLFADDDWTLGPLTLTGGLRADRWSIARGLFQTTNAAGTVVTAANLYPDRSGWETTARGGAVLALGHGLSLRGAGYTGFRMPTLNELYRPFSVPPVTTQANAALVNERLSGVEAGIDFAPAPGVRLGVTAFSDRVAHAIANVTIGTNLRQRQNVDAITARGLEFEAHAALGQLSLDGSLALTGAKVRASGAAAALNGLRPAQTPEVAASGTLAWHPRRDWTVSATVRYVGAQYEDDLMTYVLPAATTLNAYVQVPVLRGVSLVLRGENLTDATVYTRNQAGSIDLGLPRTLWAGIKVALR